MAEPDWGAIQLAYEAGTPYREIADQHGVSESYVRKVGKQQEWNRPAKASKGRVRKASTQSVRTDTNAHSCAPQVEHSVLEAADDIQTAYGITPRAASFVVEYMKDRNGTQAALRAGYAESGASVQASRLLANAKVRRAVDEQIQAQTARTLIGQDWVLGQWAAIATADVSELTQVRRGCCRHCHGVDHGYQYIDEAEHQATEERAEAKGYELPPFGGYGYTAHQRPNADCPMCGGEGMARVYTPDTRDLSPTARLLLDGIEQTKNGIKVTTRDRDAALDRIAKHLGMLSNSRVELSGPNGGPIQHEYNADDYRAAREKLRNRMRPDHE
ncbi:terminase small subunit [Zymobacter sp. IVIA_5232.4 C2]|uniref:terminase small subunit n=1 Tax=Zymobacter sp. IVIA_5232.4 C2 TaxID=3394855 RepID=UPI0039C18372